MSKVDTFNKLPPLAKTVLVIAGVAATAVVGITAYNKYKAYAKLKSERKTTKDVDAQQKVLSDKGIKPTLDQAQLSLMAGNLQTAMNGNGTSESAVYDILSKVANDADMLALIQAYGTRTISGTLHTYTGMLPETVIDQVPQTSMWRKSINDINEMLAKKKIASPF